MLEKVEERNSGGSREEEDRRNEKRKEKGREEKRGKVTGMVAVGAREVENNTVTVRRLGQKQTEVSQFETVLSELSSESSPPDMRN